MVLLYVVPSQNEACFLLQCPYGVEAFFQIRDDILDVSGNEQVLGKPINSDLKNNKTTFFSLIGTIK